MHVTLNNQTYTLFLKTMQVLMTAQHSPHLEIPPSALAPRFWPQIHVPLLLQVP